VNTAVGIREWEALRAVASANGETLTSRQIRRVLTRRTPGDWGRDIPPLLLLRGLVEHVHNDKGHVCGLDCPVRVTEAGQSATLSRRGRTWLRKRAADRVDA
jgi:hypothetical protein